MSTFDPEYGRLVVFQAELADLIDRTEPEMFQGVYIKPGHGDQDPCVSFVWERSMWNTIPDPMCMNMELQDWALDEVMLDWYLGSDGPYMSIRANRLVLEDHMGEEVEQFESNTVYWNDEPNQDPPLMPPEREDVFAEPLQWQWHPLTFGEAIDKAREESELERCTKHVNAVLRKPANIYSGQDPYIERYVISDWYDSATVASFTCGRLHE